MHVLVIGAAGMVGRKLVAALLAKGEVAGKSFDRLTLADIVAPEAPTGDERVEAVAADLSEAGRRRDAGRLAARFDLPSGGDRIRRGRG